MGSIILHQRSQCITVASSIHYEHEEWITTLLPFTPNTFLLSMVPSTRTPDPTLEKGKFKNWSRSISIDDETVEWLNEQLILFLSLFLPSIAYRNKMSKPSPNPTEFDENKITVTK